MLVKPCQNHPCWNKLSKVYFSTYNTLLKKSEETDTDQVKVKKQLKDEKIVQVFDQQGLFVGKMKFWKAKNDAYKKHLRLVEMKSSDKSKKKAKIAGDIEEDSSDTDSDILSYRLASVDEFLADVTEKKQTKAATGALKTIRVKSKIDDGGIDIKLMQIRPLLLKTGKLIIIFEMSKGRDILPVFKKFHQKLLDISTVQEIHKTEYKLTVLVTAKDSFIKSQESAETEQKS